MSTSIRLWEPTLALIVRHEGDLAAPTRNGLWVPPTADNENRLIGTVVSVGPGKYGEPCASDIKFGDIVELSRWTGTAYERHGLAGIFGDYGKDAKRYFKNPSGADERVEMGWEDDFAIVPPVCVIAKISEGDWWFSGQRIGRPPGLYPVHKRVFVEIEEERFSDTIHYVRFGKDEKEPCKRGKVVAAGSDVSELAPGDEVFIEPGPHTMFSYDDGRQVMSVAEEWIACRA